MHLPEGEPILTEACGEVDSFTSREQEEMFVDALIP
jgi:hypothetical protein